jgi:hypothetical protein
LQATSYSAEGQARISTTGRRGGVRGRGRRWKEQPKLTRRKLGVSTG